VANSSRDVYIIGNDTEIRYNLGSSPTANQWTLYNINLTETSGWKLVNGSTPSTSVFTAVLTNFSSLNIKGDWGSSTDEKACIDNVVVTSINDSDTMPPYFTYIDNVTITNSQSVAVDFNATDEIGFDSFAVNDTALFSINQTGYFTNISALSIGIYYVNVSINDTSNNLNSTIILINVSSVTDSAKPNITINSPTNTTYTTTTILLNITSVDETEIDSCWYSLDSGSINITMTNSSSEFTNTNSTMSQGSHTVNFYCNDTSNNINNSESVVFFIDSIHPTIDFVTPTTPTGNYSQSYILVNVTATDTNFDTILINFYNSTNSLLQSNSSTTNSLYVNLSSLADGVYYFNATANDTLNNLNSTETKTITLDSEYPLINLVSPNNASTWTSSLTVTFSYNVSDVNIANCSLIINSSVDQIDTSITEDTSQSFSKSLSNRNYNWSVNCTDYVGFTNNSLTRVLIVNYDSSFF